MVSVILKFLELASDYIVKSEFLEEKNELKRNLPKKWDIAPEKTFSWNRSHSVTLSIRSIRNFARTFAIHVLKRRMDFLLAQNVTKFTTAVKVVRKMHGNRIMKSSADTSKVFRNP